ncbi:MAG TPA: alpha/beta hydrolase [Chryseosolibacter sp.]|nr:alpha/beta hydrolase [Chryseosolibacter sp.]
MKNLIARSIGLYLNALALVSPRQAGRQAFLLFCRPYRLKLNRKQIDFFNTAEKFTLDADGVAVQGYKWGTGKRKVLFLHGWQSHTYRWKAYIEALPKNEFTIYSIDAPGHGLSGGSFLSVPVYSELIRQVVLDLGKVDAVVSHSLGGFSLLYTFYNYPLLPVDKIIAMAAPGEASDFLQVFKSTLGASRRVMDLLIANFRDRYDVTPSYFSAAQFAASVGIRGLIIHDQNDPEAPYHYATVINQAWKRSQLITTHGLGHNLRSATVVEHVVNFITSDQERAAADGRVAVSELK